MSSIEDLLQKTKVNLRRAESKGRLQEKLIEIDIGKKEQIAQTEAESLGIAYINLKNFPISAQAISLISKELALSLKTLCFFYEEKQIRLGSVWPDNPKVFNLAKKIKQENGANVNIYKISEKSFEVGLKFYEYLPRIKEVKRGVAISEKNLENFKSKIKKLTDLSTLVKKISLTDFMALAIAGAIQTKSSDIHIEAEEDDVKIRYRIDGILQDAASLPHESWPKIISRLKLIAGLKLNITDKPQDGRFTIFLTNDKIDVRVSTLPTAFGESVVMRLLMSSAVGLAFKDLGFKGLSAERISEEIKKTNGLILTTGPTGSGKTTTLYAILNKLNQPGKKIITLEDPVEYKLKGVNQSQIDKSKNYTFANGLRSILRQDPDIIMVGEIRDLETAEIAADAALTGHLVLSTLHTNSAAATVPRLLSLGLKPFLLAPAINVIIGQRLVRKICEACKTKDKLDGKVLEKIKKTLAELPEAEKGKIALDNLKFYKGNGCDRCNQLGYKGRIGIYEVLTMNKDITNMINQGRVNDSDLQEMAIKNGMVTMMQDGILKALLGITSVEEVFRAIG